MKHVNNGIVLKIKKINTFYIFKTPLPLPSETICHLSDTVIMEIEIFCYNQRTLIGHHPVLAENYCGPGYDGGW